MTQIDLSSSNNILKKLGYPKLIVAPMVDQSDLCFRMQTRFFSENNKLIISLILILKTENMEHS
jgi:tRNA-dihydrouridine synthase